MSQNHTKWIKKGLNQWGSYIGAQLHSSKLAGSHSYGPINHVSPQLLDCTHTKRHLFPFSVRNMPKEDNITHGTCFKANLG